MMEKFLIRVSIQEATGQSPVEGMTYSLAEEHLLDIASPATMLTAGRHARWLAIQLVETMRMDMGIKSDED